MVNEKKSVPEILKAIFRVAPEITYDLSALDLLPFLPRAQQSPGAYQPLISALF